MSQPWKLLPLAAVLAVIGALLLAPGGVVRPDAASADFDCNVKHPFQISIRNLDNGNNPVSQPGIVVKVSPDPQAATGGNSRDYVDNGNNDDSNNTGQIRENEACEANSTNSNSLYTATILSFPANYDCDTVVGTQTFQLTNNTADPVELYVGNCVSTTPTPTGTLTPTATATGTVTATPGAAATVTTSASPTTIGCSGTSIVTIQVRDSSGNPVPAGTAVTISTTLGSVSPSSGQTTDASGNAFVFVTGPANQGGTAVVTAKSGDAQGSTNVTINCGAAATATTAPPPTVAPGGGVISPPNTGDAGLKDGGTSPWTAAASIGLLIVAAFGAVGIVKVRA